MVLIYKFRILSKSKKENAKLVSWKILLLNII